MEELRLALDLVLAVAAALVGGIVAQRLGQPVLLGYLAGGLLLLWVAYRMYRELRSKGRPEAGEGEPAAKPKTARQAMIQIIAADVSMSLDNVLAVAGAARDHKVVLWTGLALSIVLMAIASNAIAKILDRYHWIAWIGFAIILYVAGDMIWDGTHEVVAATGKA